VRNIVLEQARHARAMLKICEALRDNTKALLKSNEISWQTGASHAAV